MGMKVAWTLSYSECIAKILVSLDTCPGLSDTSMCAHTEIHIFIKQFYPVVLFVWAEFIAFRQQSCLNFQGFFRLLVFFLQNKLY